MLIAVPSNNPGGLEATISEHFGHCDVFTLVKISAGMIESAKNLEAGDHESGGCMTPVQLLKDAGVDAMVCAGMGMRPLQGMQQVGIQVFVNKEAGSVKDAVQSVIDGSCQPFGAEHTCGGGGGGCGGHHDHEQGEGCGHHHQEQVERKDADGPVEKDRVVFISLKVSREDGELIDEARGLGFLFGHGAMVPGLEKALEGKVVGDTVAVTVPPEE
jgi:predicted Fe-Mo cluster-binding NifX family protein